MQSILKNGLIWIIKFYRKYISPMKTTKCPYYPTCSTYGLHAVEKYGFFKGGALAAWRIMKYGAVKGSYLAARRILRCHPFAKGGYDPVP